MRSGAVRKGTAYMEASEHAVRRSQDQIRGRTSRATRRVQLARAPLAGACRWRAPTKFEPVMCAGPLKFQAWRRLASRMKWYATAVS